MKPDYIAFLTLRVYSGTPLHDWIERGECQMMNPAELMTEKMCIRDSLYIG